MNDRVGFSPIFFIKCKKLNFIQQNTQMVFASGANQGINLPLYQHTFISNNLCIPQPMYPPTYVFTYQPFVSTYQPFVSTYQPFVSTYICNHLPM